MDEEPCALGGNEDKNRSQGGQSSPTSAEHSVEAAAASLSSIRSTELVKTYH
jgi:hypothetical protein